MVAVKKILTPQILLVSVLAGWLNQEQQKILEYLSPTATHRDPLFAPHEQARVLNGSRFSE
jgi:hypothetical protein